MRREGGKPQQDNTPVNVVIISFFLCQSQKGVNLTLYVFIQWFVVLYCIILYSLWGNLKLFRNSSRKKTTEYYQHRQNICASVTFILFTSCYD